MAELADKEKALQLSASQAQEKFKEEQQAEWKSLEMLAEKKIALSRQSQDDDVAQRLAAMEKKYELQITSLQQCVASFAGYIKANQRIT